MRFGKKKKNNINCLSTSFIKIYHRNLNGVQSYLNYFTELQSNATYNVTMRACNGRNCSVASYMSYHIEPQAIAREPLPGKGRQFNSTQTLASQPAADHSLSFIIRPYYCYNDLGLRLVCVAEFGSHA